MIDRLSSLKVGKEKGRKSALRNLPRFYHPNDKPHPSNITETSLEDEATVKSEIKKQLRDALKIFKESPLDIPLFIAAVDPNLANTVTRCLTIEYQVQWRVRRRWVKNIG